MDEYSDHRAIGSLIGKYGTCPPCHGNCSQGRNCPTKHEPHTVIPLAKGLTLDEWLQRRMPSDNMGFALALAIVGGIMIGVLVAHAWARMP